MIRILVLLVFVLAHLAACYLWFRYRMPNKSEAFVQLPLMICLPVIGLVCVWMASRTVADAHETPVSKLYRSVEKEAMAINAGRPELDTVVPFDEVLLLSNNQTRREVMMHILRRDPFMYLGVLKAAKVSSDVEITHYATTTIMEIQRDLDITMQHAEADFNANPDNLGSVNRFISALSSYIGTGLLLENRMLQLRQQLSQVLEHKLSIFPNSRSAHLQLVQNEINLGGYARAAEVAAMMREKWPHDESSWLESLQVCMISGDAEGKASIAAQMEEVPIIWSKAGRDETEFLCGA